MDVKALIIICTVIVVLAVTVFYICTKIQIENFRVEMIKGFYADLYTRSIERYNSAIEDVLSHLDQDEKVLNHVNSVIDQNEQLIVALEKVKGEKNETD